MIETIQLGTLKWHQITDPADEDLQFLKDNFDFHPLDIEDCRSRANQRPKIDIYDDYYFLILHFPYFDRWNRFLKVREVKIFWGKDYIITLGKSNWVVKSLFSSASETDDHHQVRKVKTSDALLYKILENLMLESLSLVSKMGVEVDLINRDLFNKKAEKTIERISLTRKNIILVNTVFKPQLRLFHKFESGEIEGYADDMEDYWGNILDYYQKMWDMTEDYQEIVEGLAKTFDSLQTNRTNEIMKVLTLISSILLPLTFIASLYGMNVGLPLQNEANSFWLLMFTMVLLAGGMIFYFKRKKWM